MADGFSALFTALAGFGMVILFAGVIALARDEMGTALVCIPIGVMMMVVGSLCYFGIEGEKKKGVWAEHQSLLIETSKARCWLASAACSCCNRQIRRPWGRK